METTNQIRSVKETVLSYLESKGDIADLSENDKLSYKYLDNRLIDSFGIIEMVTRFEQIFGIAFEPHHMESEEFTTIGGLIKLIEDMLRKSSHL